MLRAVLEDLFDEREQSISKLRVGVDVAEDHFEGAAAGPVENLIDFGGAVGPLVTHKSCKQVEHLRVLASGWLCS